MMKHKLVAHFRLRTALLATAITLPLALTGCGKDSSEEATEKMIEESAREQGHDMKVAIDNGKTTIKTTDDKGKTVTYEATQNAATIKTADGNMTMNTGDAAKIPDNFPEDGIRYENLKLTMAMAQDKTFMLTGTTPDAADAVTSELTRQAKAKGWTAQGTFQQGGMSMLSYAKGERSMSVTINTEEGQTTVSITVSQ